MVKFEEMQQTILSLKELILLLLENQKVCIPPYHFISSTSLAPVEPKEQSHSYALLPITGL